MSRFNDLHVGTPADAMAQLQEVDADNGELRAALCNCFMRIARLEQQIEDLKNPKSTPIARAKKKARR
jgi:hypothetical protein